MLSYTTPHVELETFTSVFFDYDHFADIIALLINGPRAAVTDDIDDGWNLRIDEDANEALGLEIFDFKRKMLHNRFYAKAFAPVMAEIEAFTGKSFATDDIQVIAPIEVLPRTAQLLILLMGQAITKFETIRQEEYQAAAREMFATSP